LGLGQGLKNIGLPNVGANMVNMASNPLLANAGTGLGANPLLSNTPFANPKVGLNANVNGLTKVASAGLPGLGSPIMSTPFQSVPFDGANPMMGGMMGGMGGMMGGMPGPMNLGPMMPGMPGMAGAGFPTPFGRMTDGTNQAGGDQMAPQMPVGMMDQMPMQNQMGAGGMMDQSMNGMGNMGGMPGMNSQPFSPMMSNDKMVMAS